MSAVRFFGGLLAWSLAEYATHRFPMHAARGSSPLADEHLDHHRTPADARPLRVDVHNLAWKGLAFAAGRSLNSTSFGLGFTVGYSGYTHLHHRIHTSRPRSAPARRLWAHHLGHHIGGPATNFGVTTPLWDAVLGTMGRTSSHL